MNKILLTGTLTCSADEVDTVLDLMATHIRLSRAEPGCLSFELWQDELTLTRFHVSEVFRNRAAFDAHQERGSSSDWGRATHHMQRDFKISEDS